MRRRSPARRRPACSTRRRKADRRRALPKNPPDMLRPDTFALTALLALLTALGPLAVDMYLPSFPDIGRLLGASPATVQLTLSLYMVAYAVGQIVYGPLSDRFGRLPVLRFALGDLLRGLARLRARAEHRDAARGARAAGARLIRRDRARARDRARPLFRRARGPRIVADGRHHGARAGRRADDRRRAAERASAGARISSCRSRSG